MFNNLIDEIEPTDPRYTEEVINQLDRWTNQIAHKDKTILIVPKKGLKKQPLKEKEMHKFLNKNKIDVSKTELWYGEL